MHTERVFYVFKNFCNVMPVIILAKLTLFKRGIRVYVRPTPFLYYEVTRDEQEV